jgi:hypothetical protein
MDKETVIKRGTTHGATWEIIQGKDLYITVQPVKMKPKTSTISRRGTIEETINQVIPIQEKGETEKAYKGRCSYMKRLVKQNGGNPPTEYPEGWKVETIEVTTKRKGLIEEKIKTFESIADGKQKKVILYVMPLSNQMNKLISNILNS